MYKITYYETPRGDQPVALFIDDLLAVHGPNLKRPYADVVRGKIRVKFSSNTVRVLYFFMMGDEIVLLHAFAKKTDRIDPGDIEIAEKRMNDWILRHGG